MKKVINFGMKKFLFSLSFFVSLIGYGQFLIEDTEGRSSLIYNRNEAGTALFNSSDKKLELNYFNYWRKYNADKTKIIDQIATFYGSGAVKNDVAKLFDGNKITPEGKIGFAYAIKLGRDVIADGKQALSVRIKRIAEQKYPLSKCGLDEDCKKEVLKKRKAFRDANLENIYQDLKPYEAHWLYFKSEYTGSKFKLFDSSQSFDDQIKKVQFNGYNMSVGWNWYDANVGDDEMKITSIFGLSLGLKRSNNFGSLDEAAIGDTQSFISTDSLTKRSAQTKQTVYKGNFDEFTEPYIAVDWFMIPHVLNKMGILLYGRLDDFKRSSVGIGLYILKNKSNYAPKGGINIGWVEDREGSTQLQISLISSINAFVR